MSTLFKVLLFTAPVLALVFYFVILRLEKIDVQHEQARQEFRQQTDDFDEEFDAFGDPVKEAALAKKRAEARLRAAEERKRQQEALAKQAGDVKAKEQEYMHDFEQAMQEYDREHQGKAPR